MARQEHYAPPRREVSARGADQCLFVDGLKLISWMDKGLSYVIVSDVDAAGAQSCIVCHGQIDEQPKFERLKPLNDPRI